MKQLLIVLTIYLFFLTALKCEIESEVIKISQIKSCKHDITMSCSSKVDISDFELLLCLKQKHEKGTAENGLRAECEHDLWRYTNLMSKTKYFDSLVNSNCDTDLKKIDCSNKQGKYSSSLYCLLDNKANLENKICAKFINDISNVVFTDYDTMKPFLHECYREITNTGCGRLSKTNESISQGSVMNCLVVHISDLSTNCKTQMLRVAEFQSDDFHKDKDLYFACRESREIVCKDVRAGDGRILRCLMNNKFHPQITKECRKQLTKRQVLRSYDYKVDPSLKSCEKEINVYKCESEKESEGVRFSEILLCLESAEKKKENSLSPQCLSGLVDVRQQLFQDYKINPEVVKDCQTEVIKYCEKEMNQRGGQVVHCLIGLVSKRKKNQEITFSDLCSLALKKLILVSDPTSDIRIDPVIGTACAALIKAGGCNNREQFDVYNCLYETVIKFNEAGKVDEECAEKVMQLQYIVFRKFEFNSKLYKACHEDAKKLCNAPEQWSAKSIRTEQTSLTFNCLYDKSKQEDVHIKLECRNEIKELIKIQAHRIDLNPLVYESCLTDMSKYCAEEKEGNEYRCLQKNYEKLTNLECKSAVKKFSIEQDEDPTLDVVLAKACSPMIKRFCKAELENERVEQETIMNCLIRVKHDPEMNAICSAGIEHHQILALKDYHISQSFAKYCQKNIEEFCPDKTSKADVIACLSEKATLDTTKDSSEQKIDPNCRKQLRFELFQRNDNINLDPKFLEACHSDIQKFCQNSKPGETKDCLRLRRSDLTEECQIKLFKREMIMAADSRTDARLLHKCKADIVKHCQKLSDPRNVLDCLRDVLLDGGELQMSCRQIVLKRLAIRRRDYRLDPRLQKNCEHDIEEHCSKIIKNRQNHKTGQEFKGNVTQCLKNQYIQTKSKGPSLTPNCMQYIRSIIILANMNYHLDPILRNSCKDEVQTLCKQELEDTDGVDGDGRVTECLKRSLINNHISAQSCRHEVLRLLNEGRADVHVDPILYRACASELKVFCDDVPLGGGQQLSCLLSIREDKRFKGKISTTCSRQLESRIEMWSLGAKLAPPETFYELVDQINTSGARYYFLIVLSGIILAIFIGGLCCGRITKRVAVDLKNK